MRTKLGDRFNVCVSHGVMLMEARNIRCGDVWDCYPADAGSDQTGHYEIHMVFTDDQIADKVATQNLRKRVQSVTAWPP